jgi:hypothetical protein
LSSLALALELSLMHPAIERLCAEVRELLARRVATLEAARKTTSFQYRDVWDVRESYAPGDFVIFGASMWHCSKSNQGVRPGESGGVWRLAVKRGQTRR